MRANVLRVRLKRIYIIHEREWTNQIQLRFIILEEYDKLNAQLPIDDTQKDKYKKNEANKNKSILLQKMETKNKWKMSQNEQRPTQDTVLSVIY